MNDSKEYKSSPPIRFRTDIESMDAYTKPTGPLPVLNLQQTSLVGTTPSSRANHHQAVCLDYNSFFFVFLILPNNYYSEISISTALYLELLSRSRIKISISWTFTHFN